MNDTGIARVPLDQNGHFVTRDQEAEILRIGGKYSPGLPLNVYDCAWCGERPRVITEEGKARLVEPCKMAGGITTVIRLEVPSGKIIVTDDLRPLYNGFDDEKFASYNSVLGQAQVIQAYAAQGCAYGPVGNSCPGLYQTGEGTYIIANAAYSEEEDDPLPVPGAVRLASIITDLWAYSIADFGDWLAKGGNPGALGWTETIADIPPGAYEFTHHTGEKDFDRDAPGTIIYAHIRKVA